MHLLAIWALEIREFDDLDFSIPRTDHDILVRDFRSHGIFPDWKTDRGRIQKIFVILLFENLGSLREKRRLFDVFRENESWDRPDSEFLQKLLSFLGVHVYFFRQHGRHLPLESQNSLVRLALLASVIGQHLYFHQRFVIGDPSPPIKTEDVGPVKYLL